MRLFLTGSSGFIGRHVLAAVSSSPDCAIHEVVAVTRTPLGVALPGVKNVVCELSDSTTLLDAMEGCDAVLHLAAVSSQAAAAADVLGCVTTNVFSSVHLADLARKASVPRFVLASTSLVYGQASVMPISENTPLAPVGVYAVSKASAESLCATAHPSVLSARIFNTYGPLQRGALVPFITQSLSENKPVTLHDGGSQVRSFLYVEDLVSGLISAVRSSYVGAVNFSGHRSTVLDVYETLRSFFPSAPDAVSVPAREGDPSEVWASHDLARDLLGWAPSTTLADGLEKTLRYVAPTA